MNLLSRVAPAALLLGLSTTAALAEFVGPTAVPEAAAFDAQGEPVFVNRSDIYDFRALPSYSEPEFVTAFVEAGKLPPVAERLPAEPLVFNTATMANGAGVYGDVMRHVIGGRPEGWNFWAGQSYGWGGIDIGLVECLTRTGPLFQVNAEDLQPMPNLAKSWDWSEDGKSLTVHLVEGAKWSDGVPFNTEDIAFYWDNIVMDPNVTQLMGASQATYGEGTTLEVLDDYTFVFHFTTAFPEAVLYAMAYGNFCPGPAHALKPHHPAFGGESYEGFLNSVPADYLNFPTMGAWVVTEHRPDDIVVTRRNPYYWKVDSDGQQLPYLNEVHFRLSTWGDRDVQAIAGTGDFSNLEQPENFVESLRRAADPAAPARLAFGPRTIGYSLVPNMSANGWGEPDERGQKVRELNRNLDFRLGMSQALDRVRLGESLVKGPFTAEYPGGLLAGTSFYDAGSTVYYPTSTDSAKAHFEAAGLTDSDGNGFYNFPGGDDVQVALLVNGDYQTEKNLAEGIVAMMADAGIKVVLNTQSGNDQNAARDSGRYDWFIDRLGAHMITVVQNTAALAPVGPLTYNGHHANNAGELDLLPFEQEIAATINAFVDSRDADQRVELMKTYQRLFTENAYQIGLTAFPGALIVNKRFANVPEGAPIFMYNWAEDNIMREQVYVPADQQADLELQPNTLPGEPGSAGPVTAE